MPTVQKYPSLIEIFETSTKSNWELNCFSDWKGVSYTYADVAKHIERLHLLFHECDLKKGDKVALLSRNSSNWAITFFAVLTYGAVAVPILHEFKPHQIHHIVNHSGSKLVFVGDMVWDSLDPEEMKDVQCFIRLEDWSEKLARKKKHSLAFSKLDDLFAQKYPDFTPETIKWRRELNEELAVINYTSGTTSLSKGVMLPYRSLWSNIQAAKDLAGLNPGDQVVSMLPMAHMFGLALEVMFEFCSGAHVHFLTRIPAPKVLLQVFAEVKPKIVVSVPLIIDKIIRKNVMPKLATWPMKIALALPFVRHIIRDKVRASLFDVFGGNFKTMVIGGAALPQDIEKILRWIKFPYSVAFGMTECGPGIAFQNHDKFKPGSCGIAAPRMEVKIDSPDPANIVGEICARGCNVMLGYYDNKEATEQTIVDGWLRTGDLGVMDKQGNLFIKGRSKNMLLGPSGQNIYPEEIEEKFLTMPLVQEIIVVQHSDHRLAALIYPDMDECVKREMSDADIEKHMEKVRVEANKDLPAYAQIAKIKIYNQEFEKTPKKSIKRFLYTADF